MLPAHYLAAKEAVVREAYRNGNHYTLLTHISTHRIDTSYQLILSTHPIDTSYQYTLLTHHINSSYQHTLSIHPINTPY